jgi:hypothetical protein
MAEQDPGRRHCADLLKAFREARGLSRAEFGAVRKSRSLAAFRQLTV